MKKIIKKLIVFAFGVIVFFSITMPFKQITDFYVISEVRPAAVLNPCYGLVFGPIGAFSCAIGNSIVDYFSNGIGVAISGFPQQFLYGLIPWLIFKLRGENPDKITNMDTSSSILKLYVVLTITCGFVAASIGYFFSEPGGFYALFKFIFLNNIFMNLVFAYPVLTLFKYIKSLLKFRTVKINKDSISRTIIKFIWWIECVSIILVGIYIYSILDQSKDNVELWNKIYNSSLYLGIFYAIAQYVFMRVIENDILKPIGDLASIWKKDRKLAIEKCQRLYKNTSEIGDLSRNYLALTDEIQRILIGESEKTVDKNGIFEISSTDTCICKLIFNGSVDDDDLEKLNTILSSLNHKCNTIEIDTKGLTFMSSVVLQAIADYYEKNKVTVNMVNANDTTKMILDITGFDSFINLI